MWFGVGGVVGGILVGFGGGWGGGVGGAGWGGLRGKWICGVGVGVLICLLFLWLGCPITGNRFINYDDNDYVTDNAHVQSGLAWRQIPWAFTNTDAANFGIP